MVKAGMLVALFGCSLTGVKDHCETQSDCLDGFTCSAGTCTTSCTPTVCDGHCGELDDHCGGMLSCGACPDHCTNHTKDPTETDVDCGGDCAPCALGLHCAQTVDCQSGTCDVDTCRAGTWSTVAAMPTARQDLVAVAGADGKIYTIGGTSTAGASAVVEVYDPNANSWTTKAAMPTPRYGMAAVLGTDDRIYVIGGDYTDVSHAGASIIVEVYNPATNMWASLPSLPVGRFHPAAAVDSTGTIYTFGGFDGTAFMTYATVATWKVGDASWSTLPDAMTTARSMHATATMPDGTIYAIGGQANNLDELAAVELYEPGMSGWATVAPMPTARKALAAAQLGTAIYAIAGSRYVDANLPYTSVVEAYDTSAHAWAQVTSMPSGRFSHAAVASAGKIYVFGGSREDTQAPTAIVDVYTP